MDGSAAELVITTTASGPVDHVHPVLRRAGAELLVDGVRVRPGHPMLLARLAEGRHLVGLPGNPLAAVSGLLTLAEPLLREATGHRPPPPAHVPVRDAVQGHPRDTRLVPVVHRSGQAVPLHYNGPAMLRASPPPTGWPSSRRAAPDPVMPWRSSDCPGEARYRPSTRRRPRRFHVKQPEPRSAGHRLLTGQLKLPRRIVQHPLRQVAKRLALAAAVLLFTSLIVSLDREGYKDGADGQVSVLDAFYYATVTLSTTGYGDIVPVSDAARLINVLVVTPLRVVFLIILVGTTLEVLAERTRQEWQEKRWRSALRDHTVVVGFGTKGRSALETLSATGLKKEQVVVIDPNSASDRPRERRRVHRCPR